MAQLHARGQLENVADFRAYVRQRLASDLRKICGWGADPDRIYANQFGVFRRPWDLALRTPEGLFQREGLISSQSLTDFAVAYLRSGHGLPDPPSLEWGLYDRYEGRDVYFPAEEISGITMSDVLGLLQEATYANDFRQAFANQLQAPDGRYGTQLGKLAAFRAYQAENEAWIQFVGGQLSDGALRLAQVMFRYPSLAERQALDIDARQMCASRLQALWTGEPAYRDIPGILLLSERAPTDRDGGTTLVYQSGSETPFTEYLSIDAAVAELGTRVLRPRGAVGTVCGGLEAPAGNRTTGNWQLSAARDDGDFIDNDTRAMFDSLPRMLTGPAGSAAARRVNVDRCVAGVPAPNLDVWCDPAEGGHCAGQLRVSIQTLQEVTRHIDNRADVLANFPELADVARAYIRKVISDEFHVDVDPYRTFVLVFNHPALGPESYLPGHQPGEPSRSISLTQVMLDMLAGKHLSTTPENAGRMGIYNVSGGVANYDSHKLDLSPSALVGKLDPAVPGASFTAAMKSFWSEQSARVRSVVHGDFLIATFLQGHDGSLSRQAVELARKIAGPANGPADRLDLSTAATAAGALPHGISMAWLAVHGYASSIPPFTDGKGRILLYWPFAEGQLALHGFDDMAGLRTWVKTLASHPATHAQLISTFAMQDLPDGGMYSGLDTALASLAAGTWADTYITTKPTGTSANAFQAITDVMEKHAMMDMDYAIRSRSEQTYATWMNRLSLFTIAMTVGAAIFPVMTAPALGVAGVQVLAGTFGAASSDPRVATAGGQAIGMGSASAVTTAIFGLSKLRQLGTEMTLSLRRFLSNTSIESATLAGPNMYRNAGRVYAAVDDELYLIEWDNNARFWRLADPRDSAAMGPRIRQDATGAWVVLEEDIPAATNIARAARLDRESELRQIERDFLRRRAALRNSPQAGDYRNGYRSAQQSPSAPGWVRPGVEQMKRDFAAMSILSTQDAERAGILEWWIEEARRAEQAAVALRNAEVIGAEAQAMGGVFRPLPQTALINAIGDGETGFCLPLCRAMAVAMQNQRVSVLLDNIAQAVANPAGVQARQLKHALVLLHSNVDALAAIGPPQITDIGHIARKLRQGQTGAWLVSTRTHTMLVTQLRHDGGHLVPSFYDPNFGIAWFPTGRTLINGFEDYLSEILVTQDYAGLYDAFGTPSCPLFSVQQIDLATMANVRLGETTVGGLSEPMAEVGIDAVGELPPALQAGREAAGLPG